MGNKVSIFVGIATCFILALSTITAAQIPAINTVVGGLNTTTGYAQATFWGITPTGVAADASVGAATPTGNVYFSDAAHQVVWAVNVATGTMLPVAGDGAFGNATALVHPTALAVDTNGNLYIADGAVVFKVSSSGGPITLLAGCLEFLNNTSACPTPFGTNIGDGGPATSALLNSPTAISVDSSGNVFIADSCLIRRVDGQTGIITTVAGTQNVCGFSGDNGPALSAQIEANGVYVDKNDDIFIANSFYCSIREVSAATGIIQTIAGTYPICDSLGNSGPPDPGQPATQTPLYQPQSVAVDVTGLIYIQEPYRLRVVNTSPHAITVQGYSINPGNIGTIAGTGVPGFSSCSPNFCDPALVAGLQDPLNSASAVAVVGSGPDSSTLNGVNDVMVIADTGNNRIRSLLGNVTRGACPAGVCPALTFFPSLAGNGLPDSIPDGYAALGGFPLSQVGGVSEDAASNLYLTLMANPRILQVYPSGNSTEVKTIGGNGLRGLPGQGNGDPALSAELQSPSSVFLDALDELILSDYTQIRVINSTRTQQSLYGPTIFPGDIQSIMSVPGSYGPALLDNSTLLAALSSRAPLPLVCAQEDITDSSGQAVVGGPCNNIGGASLNYPYSSSVLGDNGPLDAVGFSSISGMCVDTSSNLYIADSGNVASWGTYTLRVVNFGSSPITVANTTIQPKSINTVAGGGGTLPGNIFSHFLYTSAQVGDGLPATSALITPYSCYVDGNGNIFVADHFNDRIRRIDNKTGIITTVAGSQYPGFSGDGGPPANASLNYPNAIWGDQAGNLLISDSGNNRVREITGLLPVPIASISCSNCSLTNSAGSSPSAVVTLSNTGAAPLILSANPLLTDSTDFSMPSSGSTCPVGLPGLPPQSSCTVTVSVAATAAASASTNLVVADNAYWSNMNPASGPTPDPNHLGQVSGYLQATPISFTFTPAAATVGPATLIFTAVNIPQPVTISNTGTVTLTVNSVTWPGFIGAVASGTTCPTILPFTLAPSTSCSESFAFNPSSSNSGSASYSGNVSLSFNTTPASQAIPIAAYALVATGSTTLTLSNSSPSTPATANLSLVGVGTTQFSPQCVVTPAGLNVNCAYSQSNQTITASITIPSCVQVAQADLNPGSSLPVYLAGVATMVVLLVPRRYSHPRHRVFIALATALLCYTVTGLTGCANSITANPGSCVASIAPGTRFALNVTASSATGLTLGLPTPVQITVNK